MTMFALPPCAIARALLVVLASAFPSLARETWPTRAVTLIVPFAPGGATDALSRSLANAMGAAMGQPILVDNRPGAGGATATYAIARAAPDGYTIGVGTTATWAINPALRRGLAYDVARDLDPIVALAAVPNVMAIHPAVPANDMRQFIAHATSRFGRVSYAFAGVGSVGHLMGAQFNATVSAGMAPVPYRRRGRALADVAAGHVQVVFESLPAALPMLERGRLRALAISSARRLSAQPQVPTFAELGMADLDWMSVVGLLAPAGTPATIIRRLNEAARFALKSPAVTDELTRQQATPIGNSPDDFAALIATEAQRHKNSISTAKTGMNR